MTAIELLYNFNVELNTIYRMPPLESDEVFYWINKAQDRYITKRYTGYSVAGNYGVESTQKRVDDLRPLIKTSMVSTFSGNPPTLLLPNDYMHLLRVIVYTDGNCVNDTGILRPVQDEYRLGGKVYKPVYCKQAQHDDLNVLIDDPFNTPNEEYPLFTIQGSTIVMYLATTATLVAGRIVYLMKPDQITVNATGPFANSGRVYSNTTPLADYCYTEIIDNAINMYLQSISQNRGNVTETTE